MPNAPQPQLTIVGLGLIGGSLGMAVRQSKLGYQITGHDLRHDVAGQARKRGAIDRAEWNLPAAVEQADLVVVATPVGAVEQTLRDIAPYLKPGCVVSDVASTKAKVLAWADQLLPASVSFVGGHPMAGKETAGVAAAEATLFQGCVYCVAPGERADQAAIDRVVTLVKSVGARPLFIDPLEHDSYVAAISHLPFLLSTALVDLTSKSPSWRDLGRLAAGGFRDVTRLASGDPVMHRDICLTNRESILRWLTAFSAELSDLARQIQGDGTELEATLGSAKEARDKWLADRY